MKTNFLESIGSALFAIVGPIHDAILGTKKANSPYVSSEQLTNNVSAEKQDVQGEFGPYDTRTMQAYVGGTAVVAVLLALLSCGKLLKKKPVRRRRTARKTTARRTYKRRR